MSGSADRLRKTLGQGPVVPDVTGTPRDRLAEARARAAGQLSQLERDHARIVAAAQDSNADDEHDPEGATIAFEREQLAALLIRAQETRAEIDQALARLDQGTYGVCERCGDPIAPGRLEALPAVRTCITCAQRRPTPRAPSRVG